MIELNEIVTLDDASKYLIFREIIIKKERFLVGIKIENDKYLNDFKVFTETNKNGENYFDELIDQDMIKLIITSYVLDRI